jgi:hypothetical protein
VKKTRSPQTATLHIGTFQAHETILYCPACDTQYVSEELLKLKPSRSRFGYDVLIYVGKAMFLRCRNEQEIEQELQARNVFLSAREVTYLAMRFVVYLWLAHKDSRQKLKSLLMSRGGYILHLDATCEGDSPHLMTGLDEISEIVLENVKLPSEKAESIIPFLRGIKDLYGDPLAVVNDMSKAISNAVGEVFPGIRDLICHFHFLADTGKDLFGKENDKIRARLSKHGIQGKLRKRVREFKEIIDDNPGLVETMVDSFKQGSLQDRMLDLMPALAAYTLALWVLAGKKEAQGYGFPFDRPYLVFYQRLNVAYGVLKQLNGTVLRADKRDNRPYVRTLRDLMDTMEDTILRKVTTQMQEKVAVFDKLRDAMRIALPEGRYGLNDKGDTQDIRTIEKRVTEFYEWLSNDTALSRHQDYKKMCAQIKEYWDRLFSDPIVVDTPNGRIRIQPQRTNNILERLFRAWKRVLRKRSGTKSVSRTIKAMIANTPLVRNLENPEYMKIVLDGKATLEERFAEIDITMVREELATFNKSSERVPLKIKKIIRMPQLPKTLLAVFSA